MFEDVLVVDFTGLLDWELHEFEAMAFDQIRPAVDGVADEFCGRVGPI